MATPSEILNDPDFVSANAATKQAIFNKHVAQDPDFIGASGATQQAIRTRFGFEQPAVPTAPARRSIADVGKGLSESSSGLTDMSQSLAANMVMAPVAGIAGIGQGIKNLFVGGGMPAGDRVRQIQDAVAERYAPKTVAGTNALNGISPVLNFLPEVGNYAGEKVAEMGKYIPFSTPEMDAARGAMVNTGIQMLVPTALIKGVSMLKGGKTAAPALEQTAAAKAAAEQAYLVRQAGIMNTVVEGNKIGLVAVPSHMNPTPMGSVKATVFGKNAQIGAASEANTKTLPSIAKRQMGIDQRVSIAGDEGKATIVKALAEHDAPYVEIAALPKLNVLPEAMRAIEALRQRPALGAKAEAAAANAVIDDAIAGLTPKVDSVMRTTTYAKSPAEVLADIKSVREQAQTVFDSVAPTSTEVAAANARWALAKQLERILDDTAAATDPGLVPRFRDARTAKAQIHAWRDVITNEGKIDTPKLAKRIATDDLLTGEIKTAAEFASAFPEAMGLAPIEKWGAPLDHARRLSAGGVAGSVIGAMVGHPILGGGIGALMGEGMGVVNAMRAMGPKVQNANAMAVASRLANRSMVGLNPVKPNATPNGVVPFDYSQPMPNWAPGDPNYRPPAPLGGLLEGPSAESTLRGVKQRREFDYKMDKALDIMRAQSRETLPQRQGTGVQFDLDPVTGKLVPPKVDPVRIIGSEPEFANWKSSMSDVVQVVPEMNSLSGSQIAAKMMDRQWIQDTIKKLQDKERAFADIRAREPALARARDRARKPLTDGESGSAPLRGEPPSSETMARTLDFLQEQLSKTPTDASRKMPGKKTLNHLRQSETNNQLRKLADRP